MPVRPAGREKFVFLAPHRQFELVVGRVLVLVLDLLVLFLRVFLDNDFLNLAAIDRNLGVAGLEFDHQFVFGGLFFQNLAPDGSAPFELDRVRRQFLRDGDDGQRGNAERREA
jgi:hypothetical protein